MREYFQTLRSSHISTPDPKKSKEVCNCGCPYAHTKLLHDIIVPVSLRASKTSAPRVSMQSEKSLNIVIIPRFQSRLHTSNHSPHSTHGYRTGKRRALSLPAFSSSEHPSFLFCTHMCYGDYGAHLTGFRGFMRKCMYSAFLQLLLIRKRGQNFSPRDCQLTG